MSGKNKTQLSATAKKNLHILWNHLKIGNEQDFKNLNGDITWVHANHKKLYVIAVDPKFAIKTRKTYLSAIVSALELLESPLAETYKTKRQDIQKEIDAEYEKNEKTEKHIGTYEGFLERRNELKRIADRSWKRKTVNALPDNYRYIITCLYTYQFPLRKEWRTVRIAPFPYENYFRKENDRRHLILMANHGNDMMLSLGEYKSHPAIDIPISTSLRDIILDSIVKFPRPFLFTDYGIVKLKPVFLDKPITNTKYVRFLDDIGFGDESNFRSLRYSYEVKTHPRMTEKRKREIAELMRTSKEKLDTVYKKIDETETEQPTYIQQPSIVIDDKKLDKRIAEIAQVIIDDKREQLESTEERERRERKEKRAQQVRTSSKKYFDANRDILNAKKYVRKLNLPADHKDKIKSEPSDTMKKKYKLKKVKNVWVSKLY